MVLDRSHTPFEFLMNKTSSESKKSDLDHLNSIHVTLDDVIAYNDEAYQDPETISKQVPLPLQRYHQDDSLATALMVRLDAFQQLYYEGTLRSWCGPDDVSGIVPLNPAIFMAVADEPLIERSGLFVFEADSFLARVLAHAMAEGNA